MLFHSPEYFVFLAGILAPDLLLRSTGRTG